MATEQFRLKKRAEALATIPAGYNPWLHLAGTTGVGIVTLFFALWNLKDIQPLEYLVIPISFLFSNWFEWHVHKYILHRRFPFLRYIYDQHTPLHHGIYVDGDMEMRSNREFKLVLIPALGVLAIVVAAGPLAVLLGKFVSPNVGWLYLVCAALYMVVYELTHLAYHVPENSTIGRNRLVAVLRKHHSRHHDPKLMQKWNFNVSVPLFDWILGTIHK